MDQSIVLAIIFFVATIVLSVILAFKLAKKKKPVWAYKTTKIIGLGSNAPPELKLTFNGQLISDVYLTRVIVFNKGDEAILKDDVTESIIIQFRGAEILRQPEIKAKSKDAIKFSAKQVVKGGYNSIEVHFLYLDHEDGAVVDVLHTASEEITCTANIIGARQIENIGEFEPIPIRRQRSRIIFSLIVGVFILGTLLYGKLGAPSDSRMPSGSAIALAIMYIIFITMTILTPSPYFHYRRFPRWSAITD